MACLLPQYANKFREMIKNGQISPDKLIDMKSAERHKFFSEHFGEENAGWVNAQLESKLLLKNQTQGIINWAKTLTGIKPEVQRDLVSKVQRMEKILQPEEMDNFLGDLASQRLGVGVTAKEASEIVNLSKDVQKKKEAMEKGGDRLDYGRSLVKFNNFVNDLKTPKEKPKEILKGYLKQPQKVISDVASTSKAIKASLDNSALLRQGYKVVFTHPEIWQSNARKSFRDIVNTFGNKPVMDELMADIVSRPNYERMKKAGLAIGNLEEAYPTTWPEKIPLAGKAYKASEVAFTGFQYKTRADVFDKYLEIAQKSGLDINDPNRLKSIGKMVNALTGRGHLGKAEAGANFFNNVFFSPRLVKSHLDFLTAHQLQKDVDPFVRKQAAINLAKTVGGTALVLAIANALRPGSVEKDPRSSDFGKIRIGDSRFDVTGGMASVLTLAGRLALGGTKSSTTGKVKPFTKSGFGQNATDIIYGFMEGKLSPMAATALNLLRKRTFTGESVSAGTVARDLGVPLPITNTNELIKNPNSAPVLVGIIADQLGVGVNTYSAVDWHTPSEENSVAIKYGIPNIPDVKKFASVLSEISKAGVSVSNPRDATIEMVGGNKKLSGQDLDDYKIMYGIFLRNAVLNNETAVRNGLKNPKVLQEIINNFANTAKEQAAAKWRSKHATH